MLSTRIRDDFVDATYDRPQKVTESTHYGLYKGGGLVQFDGSELNTPCVVSTDISVGDRVIVSIRNNVAYITGILRRANDGN